MSENKKNLVLDGVCDSVITDEKIDCPYKKVSELSNEEIKMLEFYPVEFEKIDGKDRNGKIYSRFNLNVKLCPEFTIRKVLTDSDFYYFVNSVAVPILKQSDNLNLYRIKCPLRFVKGQQLDEFGNIRDYVLVQIIVTKKVVYSDFINRKNHRLDNFETLISCGKIKNPQWVYKNVEGSIEEILSTFNVE